MTLRWPRQLRDVPIRWKLALLIVAISGISFLLAAAWLLVDTRAHFKTSAVQELSVLAEAIGANAAAALMFDDRRAASEALAALRTNDAVLGAALYDTHARRVAEYHRTGAEVELPTTVTDESGGFLRERVWVSQRIVWRDRQIGHIYIVESTERWNQALTRFLWILALLFVGVLGSSLALSLRLQTLLTRPIAQLIDVSRRVAQTRDYSVRATPEGRDELGVLVEGFNDMLGQIEQRRREVEQAQDELRRRVKELDAEVAERKRTEAELRKSREELRASEARERARAGELSTIVEAVPATVFIAHDSEGRHITTNRVGRELLRLTPDGNASKTAPGDAAPTHFKVFQNGRELSGDELPVQRAAREGVAVENFEEELVFEDGSRRYLLGNAVPLLAEDGKPRGAVAVFVDITARKRAEEQFRLAVESAPNGMLMVDERGTIVLSNRQLESMFGYRREELVGQSIEMLVAEPVRPGHPRLRATFFRDPQARPMGGGRELYGRHKDGRPVPIEIGLNPFVTQDGTFCLAAIIDITARKRAEQDLKRYNEELQRSNRELGQFAYVASHDLQEPLRAVSGCVQLLRQRYQGKLDARADELIGHAVGGASRMQTLINDLLVYSRVGTRGRPFEQCDCLVPLREALANLEVTVRETEALITHDPLPTVFGDSTQLTQLFQNLIGNALKFRGTARPEVHIGIERKSTGFLFSVRDNGIGIEPQYFERVFGVFQRLHSRREYPGNGIGLAICRKIVERHNGRMWVDSAPGRGATFYFTIPTGDASHVPERQQQAR